MMKELNDIDEGKLTTHVRLLNDIAKCVESRRVMG